MAEILQILLLFLLNGISCNRLHQKHDLRIMTFNIWESGDRVENGLQKIAKHITILQPDIVALQEVKTNVCETLKIMLGEGWSYVENPNTQYPDIAIFTKHTIIPNTLISTPVGVGVKIMTGRAFIIHFWSVHLDYTSYGPYAANNKMVRDVKQIMAGERARSHGINDIMSLPMVKKWLNKTSSVPFFVAGDFNGPSHLDWTNETRKIHGDWIFEWPATKQLETYGFKDSYRELHRNITEKPGITWSTVNKFNPEWDYQIPEPQDRIDFIFYIGPVVPVNSFTYSGDEPLKRIPFNWENDYPSDHFAVNTDFRIM